jgi:hypothetical protein
MQIIDAKVESNSKLNMTHANIDVDEQTFQSIEGQERFGNAMHKELSIYFRCLRSFTITHLFNFLPITKFDLKSNRHCCFIISSIICGLDYYYFPYSI